jgi:hypothetical protein
MADRDRRWIPLVGMTFGTGLGFAAAFGGWSAFVLVLVLGVLGYLGGRALIGEINLGALSRFRRRP